MLWAISAAVLVLAVLSLWMALKLDKQAKSLNYWKMRVSAHEKHAAKLTDSCERLENSWQEEHSRADRLQQALQEITDKAEHFQDLMLQEKDRAERMEAELQEMREKKTRADENDAQEWINIFAYDGTAASQEELMDER